METADEAEALGQVNVGLAPILLKGNEYLAVESVHEASRLTGRAEARGYSAAACPTKRSLATKSSTVRRAAICRRPLSVTM